VGTPVPDPSIEVDDVDAALEAMHAAGFPIVHGPVDEPWGGLDARRLDLICHRVDKCVSQRRSGAVDQAGP
jgi:hypothetical protein